MGRTVQLSHSSPLRWVVSDSDGGLVYMGAETLTGPGIGIGASEKDGPLKEKRYQGIGEMKEDSSLNDVIRKGFGPDAGVTQNTPHCCYKRPAGREGSDGGSATPGGFLAASRYVLN